MLQPSSFSHQDSHLAADTDFNNETKNSLVMKQERGYWAMTLIYSLWMTMHGKGVSRVTVPCVKASVQSTSLCQNIIILL